MLYVKLNVSPIVWRCCQTGFKWVSSIIQDFSSWENWLWVDIRAGPNPRRITPAGPGNRRPVVPGRSSMTSLLLRSFLSVQTFKNVIDCFSISKLQIVTNESLNSTLCCANPTIRNVQLPSSWYKTLLPNFSVIVIGYWITKNEINELTKYLYNYIFIITNL